MAIETKTIQIRTGLKADLIAAKLLPGEQVLALDTGEVGIKSASGDIIWYATVGGANAAVPTTRKVNGKALSGDINLTATDVGAATISGYADQPWYDTPGLDTSGVKFIGLGGLDENQIYQVLITGCYNPAGSPNYRATLSGKLSFPIGYANGVITVKAQFLQELTTNGTAFSGDGNFYAVLEGGGTTLPYNTWKTNKVAYIRWSRDPSASINYWLIKIKKLL